MKRTLLNPKGILFLAFAIVSVSATAQNITTLDSDNAPLASNTESTPSIAQNSQTQNQASGTNFMPRLHKKLPQESIGSKILHNTFLTYYQQFLGGSLGGPGGETYNVFQEGMDLPGTGRAPIQSFHSVNLRYRINNDWAVGASLAVVHGYTDAVDNDGIVNRPDNEYFNTRIYANLPALRFKYGTLWSTVSYEAPTSVTSRLNNMQAGIVISESFSFNLPNSKWSAGLLGQYYRAFYEKNVLPPPWPGAFAVNLQTAIISGGPYVNYRINDKWMLGSIITFDWDQRGKQTDKLEFNNNLPHRGRISVNYFPGIKYLTNVGVFAQALLKFRPETTAIGADFALRF